MAQKSVVLPATETEPPAILIEVMIPADMALNLQRKAGPDTTLADYLVNLAARYGDLPLDDPRALHVSGYERTAIELITGRGIQNGADLVRQLERSKNFRLKGVGDITVPDDVLELIKARSYGEVDLAVEVRKLVEASFERYRVQGIA